MLNPAAQLPADAGAATESRRVNIASHLTAMAARYPDKPAVIHPARSASRDAAGQFARVTFRQLEADSNRYANGLARVGIRRGMRTILMVRPGREFFALTFALFKLGAIPVLIDPGMGRRGLVACLARIEAEAFIGIPIAHVLRVLHRGTFRSVRVHITVGCRWFWGGTRASFLLRRGSDRFDAAQTAPDETAAVLFTSGSTGPAKGVVYTHGIFDAQVRYLQSQYGYGPDEVDLATFPLFALFDAALGMTAVIPDMDASRPGAADPRKIIAAIRTHRCTHMFGSPALLTNLAAHAGQHGIVLDTLRRVITCGAPVRPELLKAMHACLPAGATIHTPFGATEALPVTDVSSTEILAETAARTADGAGTCVGRVLPGMDLRIIAIQDDPIPRISQAREIGTGEIGEIIVRGPVVTRSYFAETEATAAAKIEDDREGGFWHRMGDVGYLDAEARLWFCGRRAHRVETAGGPRFSVPCEAILNRHPAVRRSALVGIGPRGSQRTAFCVELLPEHAGRRGRAGTSRDVLRHELLQACRVHPLTRDTETILFHPGFPVDVRHNAKINREQLARWAAEQVR